ncbi:MAG: inositol monophosphatase family protein, partial [Solirubrobacteraceae bacterium]
MTIPPDGTPSDLSPLDHSREVAEAELLDLAIAVARDAGALLLERFDSGRERVLESKSTPTDLVSEADLASERLIRDALSRARPDDGFLGEEGGGEEGSSGVTWVVDPLDGTVNFLFAIPQWCVSVAVRDSHGVLAGAVFDPCRDELFTATRHGDSLLNGTPLIPSVCADLATAMVATGFAYDASVRAAQAAVLARLLPRVRDIRRFGSAALDLVWTAAGRYDAYFERTVKPWDIAAGTLVCERAGLNVVELVERPGLPFGVLAAGPALSGEMLALVN